MFVINSGFQSEAQTTFLRFPKTSLFQNNAACVFLQYTYVEQSSLLKDELLSKTIVTDTMSPLDFIK